MGVVLFVNQIVICLIRFDVYYFIKKVKMINIDFAIYIKFK